MLHFFCDSDLRVLIPGILSRDEILATMPLMPCRFSASCFFVVVMLAMQLLLWYRSRHVLSLLYRPLLCCPARLPLAMQFFPSASRPELLLLCNVRLFLAAIPACCALSGSCQEPNNVLVTLPPAPVFCLYLWSSPHPPRAQFPGIIIGEPFRSESGAST